MKTSLLQQQVTLLKELVSYYEDNASILSHPVFDKTRNRIKAQIASIEQEGKEAITQPPLYPCPYSIAVHCILEEPCMGCETWGKFMAGEEVSRMQSPAPTLRDELIDYMVWMSEREFYGKPAMGLIDSYLSSKATKQTEK